MAVTAYDLAQKFNAAVDAHRSGRPDEAERLYRACLQAQPAHGDALRGLAMILLDKRELTEAGQCIGDLLNLNPSDAIAQFIAGEVARFGNKLDQAVASYRKAIDLDPAFVAAHGNLGIALEALSRFDEAARCCERILEIAPQSDQAMFNLASLARRMGDFEKARALFEQVVVLNPQAADAHFELARMAADRNNAEDAIGHLRAAVAINPGVSIWWDQLGIALHAQQKLAEARACFESAVDVAPESAGSWNNLGNILGESGEAAKALECLRQAVLLSPEFAVPYSGFLLNLNYQSLTGAEQVSRAHLAFDVRYGAKLPKLPPRLSNLSDAGKRLRVGYVSPDFRRHSVAFFLEPLLRAHDPAQVEIFCYSDVMAPDEVTQRLQDHADVWRDIKGRGDLEVADIVRADEIDILVDLAGHMAGSRLLVFARQPAPVQVAYLGYPNTTGLNNMQYRITDEIADPPGEADRYFSERLVRLPRTFLCYQPPEDAPEPASERAESITFGSFNNLAKVTPEVVGLWARVLVAVPGSRLLLKASALSSDAVRERLRGEFESKGVSRDRLELLPWKAGTQSHLGTYRHIDIALDTFPYNGTTTTCEALWMGVPVVTLAGKVHASRVGHSLLSACGLDELVATTSEQYVEIALGLAQDRPRLERLRRELRQRVKNSPLLDERGMGRAVEAAFREMWQGWCRGESVKGGNLTESGDVHRGSVVEQPWFVRIKGGVEICVPPSVHFMSTYILLEQEDWMEGEIEFVRQLLEPGMDVIDIGANHGVYALIMAARVGPAGRVWAFEPARATAEFLAQAIARNGLGNLTLVTEALSRESGHGVMESGMDSELGRLVHADAGSEAAGGVAVTSLDDAMRRYGWGKIDFVKMDAEGEEVNILAGGAKFFAEQSPLVMFELNDGDKVNHELVEAFHRAGYGFFRLVPGLNLLEPWDRGAQLEPYQLNLFCCKADRLAWLQEKGWVVTSLGLSSQPLSGDEWVRGLRDFPFAAHFMDSWRSNTKARNFPGASDYRTGLADYFTAHLPELTAAARLGHLKRAFDRVLAAFNTFATGPRLMMAARIAEELGHRSMAVQGLARLVESLPETAGHWMEEPFLPPAGFEAAEISGDIMPWLHAGLVTAHERLKAYSSFYSGQNSLAALEALAQSSFQTAEMERRRQLICMRYAKQIYPEYHPGLIAPSQASLNPEFWRGKWFPFCGKEVDA
jgi:FkbM family methyltransferase